MTKVSSYSQLSLAAEASASLLTEPMEVEANGTQPVPADGPSLPNKKNQALASLFSVNAGGQEVKVSALTDIASGLIDDEDTSYTIRTAGKFAQGLIDSGIFSNEVTLEKGAEALGGNFDTSAALGSALSAVDSLIGTSSVNAGALAAVANSAAQAAAKSLGFSSPSDLLVNSSLSSVAEEDGVPKDWIFITTPGQISWKKQGETSVVNTYGSNNPYVIYSTTSKRSLSLGECLIEGFSDKKEVEDHVKKLEAMMTMVMNTQVGYVSPYVWDLRANDKSYGKFLIESVSVKEHMRNEKGRADRAMADIELIEVPDFQINDGRDLSTSVDLASGKSIASAKSNSANKNNNGNGADKANATKAGEKKKGPPPPEAKDPSSIGRKDPDPDPVQPKPKT